MSLDTSITTRNIATLRSTPIIGARTLQYAQDSHPDHRVFSTQGNPFPSPANGMMKSFADIDFRNTSPEDLPEGMVARKTRASPQNRASPILGKSKWDFQYMESGASIAVRLKYAVFHELYLSEFERVRKIGIRMVHYQKTRGYIDPGFLVQTSAEDVVVTLLPNGYEVLAPHIVFWRIDGTPIDPEYQGN